MYTKKIKIYVAEYNDLVYVMFNNTHVIKRIRSINRIRIKESMVFISMEIEKVIELSRIQQVTTLTYAS